MWKLDAARGTLETPELAATVDLTKPHDGLIITAVRQTGPGPVAAPNTLRILQVHFPELPRADDMQDSWVRGTDLVVTYAQRKTRQVTAEIYWRLVRSCANTVGAELILSVQTDLLDATPTTSASSQIQLDEILWLGNPRAPQTAQSLNLVDSVFKIDRMSGEGIFVARVENASFSYVEMVHPTDFSSATVQNKDGQTLVGWQLFPESLEKGVIRRARLRGLFVDRQNDLALAAQCFEEFTTSAPPLTT